MSSDPLMVTVSGIRGISGTSLSPPVIMSFVSAFATLLILEPLSDQINNKIVVGSDSRVSGPWVKGIVCSTLMSHGFDVVDIGIVPTPTVQLKVQQFGAAGGVVVTSSHNPVMWNGLKFVDSDGLFVVSQRVNQIIEYREKGLFEYAQYDKSGGLEIYGQANDDHIATIHDLEYVDVETIRKRRFKVALDSVNGAGGPIMKQLLESFGVEVVGLNLEPTGVFAHVPEPIPCNLGDLGKLIVESGADFGIAVDPDVDRCVFLNEMGIPIGEELTLAIAVSLLLQDHGKRGIVCKNLSSSRVTDDIAQQYGSTVIAAAVGEINVAVEMVKQGAIIGGEGNGGVMLPDIHIGRDAPVAAALALSFFSRRSKMPLSQLLAQEFPVYVIQKEKYPVAGKNFGEILERIVKDYSGYASPIKKNDLDGLRIDCETEQWWVHIRKSNTEPVVRIIAEAPTQERVSMIVNLFAHYLE